MSDAEDTACSFEEATMLSLCGLAIEAHLRKFAVDLPKKKATDDVHVAEDHATINAMMRAGLVALRAHREQVKTQ